MEKAGYSSKAEEHIDTVLVLQSTHEPPVASIRQLCSSLPTVRSVFTFS